MRLLNTKNRLPGGWRYEQFDAVGNLLHKFQSFDPWMMFLGRVQAFRAANKLSRTDIGEIEADVTEYLARQFGGDPRYFILDNAQKKTSFSSRFQSGNLAKLAATGRKLLNGASIISDWLGDGLKPVAPELAQDRADICTGRIDGNRCPHNNPGWIPVSSIAAVIRSWSEQKNAMNLTAIGEENLQSCDVCLCDLKTKIHVPMETIADRTPKAMFEKFASEAPSKCWMRSPQP